MKNSLKLYCMGLLTLCINATSGFAKDNTPLAPKELAPDWVHVQLPQRTNTTYFYQLITIEDANSRSEAEDRAERQAYQTAAKNQGIYIDASTAKVSEMEKKIFLHMACSYKEEKNGRFIYHFLYQISESGRTKPQYDNCDCNSTELGRAQRKDLIVKSNTRALLASTFIPGMGQMLKKQGGTGAAFLISEIALFGGGTACYFLGEDQVKIMKSTGTSYSDFQNAKNLKNTLDIAMFTCFGIGAAVHIANMVHAWYVRDKKLVARFAFTPAIIPTNEYSTPNYAMGAGVQIKF